MIERPAAPPIPPEFWERICRFLAADARRYGRIELDVADGRVVALRFTETVKLSQAIDLRETA